MHPKSTANLLKELLQVKQLDNYFEANDQELLHTSLPQELNKLLTQQPLSKGEIAVKSGLSRVYVYQIFSGQRIPSRDSLLRICFALSLEPEAISKLLKHTGYPVLYPRDRRDSVILFAAKRHKTVIELDEMLRQQQLPGMQR